MGLRLKQNVFGIGALIVSVFSIGLHFSNKPQKIAYAETSVLLSEFTEAVKARKQFEESQKEWDKNLKTLNDSLVAAMEHMKLGYENAKPAEKDSMRAILQKRNDDLQRYTNAVRKMSEAREKQLMDPVIKKINGFLEDWGKKNGYSLILGTMAGGNILQAKSDLNVTSSVLVDLNKFYSDGAPDKSEKVSTKSASDSGIGKTKSGASKG